MDEELICRIGEALYGSRWHSDLARDLGVSDRQVRRWATGAHVPPGVYIDLMHLMQNRAQTLDDLIDKAKRMG